MNNGLYAQQFAALIFGEQVNFETWTEPYRQKAKCLSELDVKDRSRAAESLFDATYLKDIFAHRPVEDIVQLQVTSSDFILQSDFPEPEFIIKNLLPMGLATLGGKPKEGKSWMGLQIAQAVASGTRIFDQNATKGNVFYLALEDSLRRLKDRMRKQGWSVGLDCDFMLMNQYADQIGDLRRGYKTLLHYVESKRYKLVIIDTWARALFTDQNDPVNWQDILDRMHHAAHDIQCCILLIDHHKKSAGDDAVRDILGHTAKTGLYDTIWGLYRNRSESYAKLEIVGRDIDEQKLKIAFNGQSGLWTWLDEPAQRRIRLTMEQQEVIDVVYKNQPCKFAEVHKVIGGDKGNLHRRVNGLVADGFLLRDSEKKYSTNANLLQPNTTPF